MERDDRERVRQTRDEESEAAEGTGWGVERDKVGGRMSE